MSATHGLSFQRGLAHAALKPLAGLAVQRAQSAALAERFGAEADLLEPDEAALTAVQVGKFGNLFEELPGFEPSDEAIKQIASKMVEEDESDASNIPLAFAFLGQFIDHDITLDPVSRLDERLDPDAIRNFRTPALDLDNVYGEGPDASRHLYDTRGTNMDLEHRIPFRLLIGDSAHPRDLPRNSQGTAIIGDPRNDENLLVSQIHAAMLRFHNAVIARLIAQAAGNPPANKDIFEEARRLVTTHYHYVVVNDFLPLICGQAVVDDIKTGGRDFFNWELRSDRPYIPTEFGGAAYRMGHTLVRNHYQLNDEFSGDHAVPLFDLPFFGLEKDPNVFPIADNADPRPAHGPASGGYDPRYAIDFAYFVGLDGNPPVQTTRPVDAKVAKALFDLPFINKQQDPPASLPERNMRRGRTLKLPSGQEVAHRMGFTPRTNAELGIGAIAGLDGKAPLWFYILKESELENAERADGLSRLGSVGGRIVAEVILGLIEFVQKSYDPLFDWTKLEATLAEEGETFDFGKLLTFADS